MSDSEFVLAVACIATSMLFYFIGDYVGFRRGHWRGWKAREMADRAEGK